MQRSNPLQRLPGVFAGLLPFFLAGAAYAAAATVEAELEDLLRGLATAQTPGAQEARKRAADGLRAAQLDATTALSGRPRRELRLESATEWAQLGTALEKAQVLEKQATDDELSVQELRGQVEAARVLHEETVARRARAAAQLQALQAELDGTGEPKP